ncbi:MAG TPA: sensor histidine kinase [Gammaproteobacteria bacterium]|nr:sensor histidine kinase [Gammaproteobacteria bacterium]
MSEKASPRGFLPNFCDVRLVFAWVLTAELLALVLTLAAPEGDFWQRLSQRSLFVQWVALALAGMLCLGRGRLNRLGHLPAAVLVWLLGLGVTVLVHLAAQRLLGGSWRLEPHLLAAQLGIAAIVLAVALRYLYELHCQQQRELAEARARALALQARIRPHFLFNSMNTLASLTRSDPALAEQVVEDLSDLFRASLADDGARSTLGQELELARGYLRIEAQRLGERLRVQWDLEPELPLDAPMPPLLLQPLLENAVYHGIEPALEGGEILVSVRARRGLINISVSNTLPPAPARARPGNRMAQRNIADRLHACYGEAAGMRIGEVEGRYQVRIHFPRGEASRR